MGIYEHKLRFRRRPLPRENVREHSPAVVATEEKPSRFDNIAKSQQDSKSYRGLILENGVKVLLVSDPTASKSAACLCVEAGHMNDPADVPGLAHLVEHTLFLGSAKFPQENHFRSFIYENCGFCNAQTFADVTKFFFDVLPDKLSEALGIFSQMFISPLFREASIMREISAVNSEHEKNLASDAWRMRMVNKVIANPQHPYSKFSTGNTQTLLEKPKRYGIDLREELLTFYETFYRSGNRMNLVIVGRHVLDELEAMAREHFSIGIDNKEIEAPLWSDQVYTRDQMMTKTYIVPLRDVRTMTLTFPTPDLLPYYKSSPEEFVVNLVGHEGPGSIISELKKRGWSNSLNCDHIKYAKGFGFFEVKVDLTDEGFESRDKIVKLIFQYFNLLRDSGVKEWIFEENRNLRELEFRFEDSTSPIELARKVVSSMRHYPFPEVLTGSVLISEWRPDLIHFILSMLTPSNMRITIVDQSLFWKCRETEKIYNTSFGTEAIPQTLIRDWTACGHEPRLQLPQPNVFIPTDFDFLPIENWKQTFPRIIRDTSLIRVWFKQDTEFRKPKSIMTIELKNATIHCDPLNWNLTHLFVWMLEDHLKEQLYVAGLAGLECKIAITTSGIRIYIDGYSHKQNVFLETILKETFRFKIDKRRFEETYDSYLADLQGVKSDKPQQIAIYYLGVILTEQMWTNEELIASMRFVTLCRMKTFVKEILSQTHAECFIFGNVNEERAKEFSNLIEDRLEKARSSSKSSLKFILAPLVMREMKLPEGSSHVFRAASTHHKVNCTSIYVQCGIQDDKSNVLVELILQIIKEPFFNVLRTQEQQGYLVDCLLKRAHGAQGIKFVVESAKRPEFIEQRVSSFLSAMANEIEEMPAERFETFRKALKSKKLLKPLTLSNQFWEFYREISSQQYHFNRTNVEASLLKSVTQAEVVTFFKSHIAPDSEKRRSVSIHVTASKPDKLERRQSSPTRLEGFVVIDDALEFKASLQPFPKLKTRSLRQFLSKKQ